MPKAACPLDHPDLYSCCLLRPDDQDRAHGSKIDSPQLYLDNETTNGKTQMIVYLLQYAVSPVIGASGIYI